MGGPTNNEDGRALDEHDNIIPCLHAAGELYGGIRGDNRLGGNSLLKCMAFGTGVMGTMVLTQPSVSIHRMSNMAMHLSRKEQDYSWLRWMMQNNATTQQQKGLLDCHHGCMT
jgi:aspartate oxidase